MSGEEPCRSGHTDCTADCGWCKGTGIHGGRPSIKEPIKDLLARSSLSEESLWLHCPEHGRQARDPFTDECVMCPDAAAGAPTSAALDPAETGCWQRVRCGSCGRTYTCSPDDDHYLRAGDAEGSPRVCLACLVAPPPPTGR